MPSLILASSSIYRRELLARLNIPFESISPNIDETPLVSELPQETALRLSQKKAEAIHQQYPKAIIIGSDQVATLNNQQIGKPLTHEKALAQLLMMQGQTVLFHSALCVLDGKRNDIQTANVITTVKFRNLPKEELNAYLLTEKPYDCAGSARNEALGIILLEQIESTDPTALTGLPLITLTTMLRNCGLSFFHDLKQ